MYNVVSSLLEVVVAVFQGYCLQYFCGSFLDGRLREKKWNRLLVIALYGISKLAVNSLLESDYKSIKILGKQAVFFIVLLGLAACCYKAVRGLTLFLVVTFMAVSEISLFLGFAVVQMGDGVIDIWNWCLEKGYINSPGTFLSIIETTVVLIQMLMGAAVSLILYFCLKKIVNSFTEKDYRMQRTELLFVLVPGLASLLICMLLRIIMVTVENDIPRMLYDRYPALAAIVPAILILSLLSIVYGVRLFQDMIVLNREKNSRVILEKQISSLQEHMGEIERVRSGIRGIRHDMKNALSIVMQLAGRSGDDGPDGSPEGEELRAYLSELNRSIDRLAPKCKTGNAIADAILTMKYHEIIHDIPELEMDMDGFILPDTLFIQSYDLGVILGNALDNALEACRKLKGGEAGAKTFIRISSFQRGVLLFLKVENSFDGNIIRKRQSEFPATDKADEGMHGIGLANIKSTVQKYEGAVDWRVDGRVFTLSVMMKNED